MSAVVVADLEPTYAGGTNAVRGISFSVERGEVFGLLGTNGAGKTSTVDVVTGLANRSCGSVSVLGHDPVRERRRVRPRTGVVLQSGNLPGALQHKLDAPVKSSYGGERRRWGDHRRRRRRAPLGDPSEADAGRPEIADLSPGDAVQLHGRHVVVRTNEATRIAGGRLDLPRPLACVLNVPSLPTPAVELALRSPGLPFAR